MLAMHINPRQAGRPPLQQPRLRVFLVEDFAPVRERIVEEIEELGRLELAGVAEGEEEALSWLNSHQCDILILDLELRQGNGLGVLKALQADPRPVKIVYSNHVSGNIRGLAERFGASHFFDKTLDTPKLRQLLEQLSAED
jgi:two-component system, OmpR family, response regulator